VKKTGVKMKLNHHRRQKEEMVKKASTSKGHNKSLADNAKDEDAVEGKAEKANSSVTVLSDAPVTDLSISVMKNEANSEGRKTLVPDLHFKCKCWDTFTKAEVGIPYLTELGEKQDLLKQYTEDHKKTLKEVISHLSKLVAIELNIDQLEPNREKLPDEDELSHLTTKEQRNQYALKAQKDLQKLKQQEAMLLNISAEVDKTKRETDQAFDQYCADGGEENDEEYRPVFDGDLESRYDEINRIATAEAVILLQKAYPVRPPWSIYY